LILNPIVENAVKFGYDSSEGALKINISAKITDSKKMILTVENSGKWKDHENEKENSTGLKNVKRRIELFYPDSSRFTIQKNENSVKIILELSKQI
jgi:LytS/YehU family sensor histidine kinase